MSAKSAEILEHIAFLKDVDDALSSLLAELRRQGQCAGMCNNLHIIAEAENRLVSLWKSNAEQAQQLRSLRECCDKQVVWIKSAMDAMHPECEVTSNPDSFRGKTFRLHQTGEIDRLQEINNNLIEANERLSAKVGDWDAVCKALWDRGYGQLPQQVNETPLGSCLRLIDQGSPDPEVAKVVTFPRLENWTHLEREAIIRLSGQKDISPAQVLKQALRHYQMGTEEILPGKPGQSIVVAGGEASYSQPEPAPEIPWVPWQGGLCPLKDEEVERFQVRWHTGKESGICHKPSDLGWKGGTMSDIIAYRVLKWKRKKEPLEASDLPLGTVIRFASDPGSESLITSRNEKYVWLGSATTGVDGTYLMHEGGEYRLPGTDDWKPCYKLVPRTPSATV